MLNINNNIYSNNQYSYKNKKASPAFTGLPKFSGKIGSRIEIMNKKPENNIGFIEKIRSEIKNLTDVETSSKTEKDKASFLTQNKAVSEMNQQMSKKELSQKLSNMVNWDGSPRFTSKDVKTIIKKSKETPEILNILEMRNYYNLYRFERNQLDDIIEILETDKKNALKLFEMKNPNNSYRFEGSDLYYLSRMLKTDKNNTMKLLEMKNTDGAYRFNGTDLIHLKNVEPKDMNNFNTLIEMKNSDNSYRFTAEDVNDMLEVWDQTDTEAQTHLRNILLETKSDGNYKYSGNMVPELFQASLISKEVFKNIKQYIDNMLDYTMNKNYNENFHMEHSPIMQDAIVLVSTREKPVAKQHRILFDTNSNVLKDHFSEFNPDSKHLSEKMSFPDRDVSMNADYQIESSYGSKFYQMINSEKVIKGKNDKILNKEYYELSNSVDDKYNIVQEGSNGKKYKIGLSEKSADGDILMEKSLVNDNGVKTDYFYRETPDGGRMNFIKITDENGQKLLENRTKFKKLDENTFESIENGTTYNIKYLKDKVISEKQNGDKVEIPIVPNGEDGLSRDLLPILKQLPGSMYFDIQKMGLNKIAICKDNNLFSGTSFYTKNECTNDKCIMISKELAEPKQLFVLLHELGHYKDWESKTIIHTNKELSELYNAERFNFMHNQSNLEVTAANYFVADETEGLKEMIAETNALLYANNNWNRIEQRGQYLQQHFPKTFAKIAELLTKQN